MRGHAAEMGVVAPLGGKGLAELQTEIAAADEAAMPASAKQAIALLGREAERIALRLRAIDAKLMQQHKANPVSRRLAAIPGIGPIGALRLALRVDAAQFQIGAPFRSLARAGTAPMLDCRQTTPGRHQPCRRRAATAVVGAGSDRGHPTAKPGRPATSAWLRNLLAASRASSRRWLWPTRRPASCGP